MAERAYFRNSGEFNIENCNKLIYYMVGQVSDRTPQKVRSDYEASDLEGMKDDFDIYFKKYKEAGDCNKTNLKLLEIVVDIKQKIYSDSNIKTLENTALRKFMTKNMISMNGLESVIMINNRYLRSIANKLKPDNCSLTMFIVISVCIIICILLMR